jgi:hypothetical protein
MHGKWSKTASPPHSPAPKAKPLPNRAGNDSLAGMNILRVIVAVALFGFGLIIVVGFIGVMLEDQPEDPLWVHLLSVTFMGILPIVAAVLLFPKRPKLK